MSEQSPRRHAAHQQESATPESSTRREFIGTAMMGVGALAMLGSTGLGHAATRRGDKQGDLGAGRNAGRIIVVTAPTGNIGGQVLRNLAAAGVAVRVIARDPSRLPSDVVGLADVIHGSHGDAHVIDAALRDADALLWLCPPDPRASDVMSAYVDFTRPAAQAIRHHGVRQVVSISALGRGTSMAGSAGNVTASLAMDDLLAGTGAAFRALVMPSFMDNVARQSGVIASQGAFFSAIDGDRRMPSVATKDIAAVASGLLVDSSWKGQEEVAVLGPEDLSFNDMAGILSDVLGRSIAYRQVSYEQYREGFIQRGMSDAMAQAMTDMARAKSAGLDNGVQRTSDNSTPTSFRSWCIELLLPTLATS